MYLHVYVFMCFIRCYFALVVCFCLGSGQVDVRRLDEREGLAVDHPLAVAQRAHLPAPQFCSNYMGVYFIWLHLGAPLPAGR